MRSDLFFFPTLLWKCYSQRLPIPILGVFQFLSLPLVLIHYWKFSPLASVTLLLLFFLLPLWKFLLLISWAVHPSLPIIQATPGLPFNSTKFPPIITLTPESSKTWFVLKSISLGQMFILALILCFWLCLCILLALQTQWRHNWI